MNYLKPPGSESQGKESSLLLGGQRVGDVIDGFSRGSLK